MPTTASEADSDRAEDAVLLRASVKVEDTAVPLRAPVREEDTAVPRGTEAEVEA